MNGDIKADDNWADKVNGNNLEVSDASIFAGFVQQYNKNKEMNFDTITLKNDIDGNYEVKLRIIKNGATPTTTKNGINMTIKGNYEIGDVYYHGLNTIYGATTKLFWVGYYRTYTKDFIAESISDYNKGDVIDMECGIFTLNGKEYWLNGYYDGIDGIEDYYNRK